LADGRQTKKEGVVIGEYTSWFENLDIYQEWMKNLPEPLNNAAFASAVFLGAAIFLLTAVVNRILLVRWNARQRRARRRMEEQRRQEMEEQRERDRHSREDREQMDLYLRFLMTAQMQNFTSLQGITFGQWKSQMLVEQVAGEAGKTAGNIMEGTGKETGAEINAGAEDSARPEINTEVAAPDLPEMTGGSEESGVEKADEEAMLENGNSEQAVLAGQAGESCPMEETMMEEIPVPEEEKASFMPEGSGQDGCASIRLSGELGLPAKRVPDNAAGKATEAEASPETLRSLNMAAVMERIRWDGDSGAAEELSPGQQSDFAKVLARMREDVKQQDYLERFRREKSEIVKNNLSVLEKSAYPPGENSTEGKDAERKTAADEEMERRKAVAREAIRQAERLEQEKGKKKGLFHRRK